MIWGVEETSRNSRRLNQPDEKSCKREGTQQAASITGELDAERR
jgi:hypothetical protein